MKGKLKVHLLWFLPMYVDLCSVCVKKLINRTLSWIRVGDDMTDIFLTVTYTHTTHTMCSPDWLSVQDLYTCTLSLKHRKHKSVA